MPAQFVVNPADQFAILQFLDSGRNAVAEPAGAVIEFSVDNEMAVTVAADPNNPLKANLTPGTTGGIATLSATITGVDDVNGQPYVDPTLIVTVYPAQPGKMVFG